MKLQFDLLGAEAQGETRHPTVVLKELNITYERYEGCPVADCIFLHGAKAPDDNFPAYIRIVKESTDKG